MTVIIVIIIIIIIFINIQRKINRDCVTKNITDLFVYGLFL